VLPGIQDLRDLVRIFTQKHGQPHRVYLGGASEGGIITTLAVEQYPDVFDGGLAACGPIGDFRGQINYWGNFRVVFDYFFPGVLWGSPTRIPQDVIDNWDSVYLPRVTDAIKSDPHATDQLLSVTHAPIDKNDPASVEETISDLLWYNVFATNDGVNKLYGQPFDNRFRIYFGSDDDGRLNRLIERIKADPAALQEIKAHYETSGQLVSPLVTIHTTGDPIVPYWHELLYSAKVSASGSQSLHVNIPVFRYGHCNFKVGEVLLGFALLVHKVSGTELAGAESVLPDAASRMEFRELLRQYDTLH
jgi:pimeloyl-ACP methyl ester carboxylesterase